MSSAGGCVYRANVYGLRTRPLDAGERAALHSRRSALKADATTERVRYLKSRREKIAIEAVSSTPMYSAAYAPVSARYPAATGCA